MTITRRKTFMYFALSLALVAVVVFWVGMDTSWAQTTPVRSAAGTAVSDVLGSFARGGINLLTVIFVVNALLTVLFTIFSSLLGVVGVWLDNVFNWNLIINPSTLTVVLDGWRIMRDLANGLFILIVLWIAITIIFNLDNLGGRKLLVRVIVVALLINFSLLMVSAVFGFANILARPFHTALGLSLEKGDRGFTEIFMRNSQIQQVADNIRNDEVLKLYKDELKKSAEAPPIKSASRFASVWNTLGAPQEAHAIWWAPLIAGGLRFIGTIAAFQFADSLLSAAVTVGTLGGSWQTMLNLALADGFLLVTLLSFFTMFVLLVLRIAAMMFLGIFAPVAFLGLVIPRYGERFWNQWLSYLFNWAFMAPVFYFMLYIGLLFLERVAHDIPSAQIQKGIGFTGDVFKMLNLMMFLIFLWTAIITARKMGGAIAETALTFGKKLAGIGLGLGTGFAARWALPAAGKLATGAAKWINERPLARSVFGRGLPGYGLRRIAKASRQQIIDAQARINSEGMTSLEIQQAIASGRFKNQVDVAAAVSVLRSRGDLDPQGDVQGYTEHLRPAATTLRNLNLDFIPLVRANPVIAEQADFDQKEFDLDPTKDSEINKALKEIAPDKDIAKATDAHKATARQTAIERLAWRRLRPQDVDTMDLSILKDDHNKYRFLEMASGEHLSKLGRRDTNSARSVQEFLEQEKNKPLWESFSDAKKKYFRGGASTSIGIWKVPAYAAKDNKGDTGGDDDGSSST